MVLDSLLVFILGFCSTVLVFRRYALFNDGMRGEDREVICIKNCIMFFIHLGLIQAVGFTLFSKEIPIHTFLLLSDVFGLISCRYYKLKKILVLLSGISNILILILITSIKQVFVIQSYDIYLLVNTLIMFSIFFIIFKVINIFHINGFKMMESKEYINKNQEKQNRVIEFYHLLVYVCLAMLCSRRVVSIDFISCYLNNEIKWLYILLRLMSNGINTSYSIISSSVKSTSGSGLVMFSYLLNNNLLACIFGVCCFVLDSKIIEFLGFSYMKHIITLIVEIIRTTLNNVFILLVITIVPIVIYRYNCLFTFYLFSLNLYCVYKIQINLSLVILVNIICLLLIRGF